MNRHHRGWIAALAVAMIVAVACGQKPGVFEAGGGLAFSGGAGGLPEGYEIIDGQIVDTETGEVLGSAEDLLGSGGGGDAAAGGQAGSDGPGDAVAAADAAGGGGGGGAGSAIGVSDRLIKIGVHAPITGAAPVPSQSFQKGKDMYWDYLEKTNNLIFGRNVEAVFRNDNYNPSQAVSACREMVEKEKVFLLVGVAGTDQIQACGRYAASVGVPYLSGGVTEIGLRGLPNYFATWMSYKQQGPLLTQMMVKKLGARNKKNGMLRFNTPTFQDAHDSWVDAMRKAGASVDYDRAVSKTAGASEAQAIATELNQQGIDNLYVLTSPTFFIQLAQAAANQRYFPTYTGVGLSMTLDTVANVACRNSNSIDNARFLGPIPAYVDSNRFDPQFRREGGEDDIQFGLWGASKLYEQMLRNAGRNLTRERFVSTLERAHIKSGILPDVRFSPNDRFGGTSMHLLRADCSQNRWVTEQAFARGF